ncbi:hypothetical protein IQ249_06055 [Lusitaniella coriacea LEGE 07157]|uniref:Uncharacterized protein n=1 Tax=Lusitaniella coriacea LEGE 07157 TaxID=945747 RepID=A0A8J7DV06_9CYAN|nr:hypothetical protein [Lusitaniella coriacea]MBE9115460.1 hypothetical protein [Lusitaniella coriacea LEGE 07157]
MMSVVSVCYEKGAYYFEAEVMGIDNAVVESLFENRREVSWIQRKHNLEKIGVKLKESSFYDL